MPPTTSELQRQYAEQGYVIVPDVFTALELDQLNTHLDEIVKGGDYVRSSGKEGSIHALSLVSQKAKQYEEDERLINLVGMIVNPGVAIFSSKLVTKLPFAQDVCHWHQDDAYFKSPCQTRCSVWIPLQNTDEKNGCLWVIPGSHRTGLVDHESKPAGLCRLSVRDEDVDLSKAIPIPAQAGSLVIFHTLTWHHSKNNETAQTRRAFIISYQEATAPKNGSQWRILRSA